MYVVEYRGVKQYKICTVCITEHYFARGEDPPLRLTSKLVDLRVGYAKWIRRASSPSRIERSSVNMMHAVASYLRRVIEVVITGERVKTIEIVLMMRYRPKQGEIKQDEILRIFRLCDGGGHELENLRAHRSQKRRQAL